MFKVNGIQGNIQKNFSCYGRELEKIVKKLDLKSDVVIKVGKSPALSKFYNQLSIEHK